MKGYFRKRGKTWSFTVDLGKDENGKRKQKTKSGFKTKKEAEAVCAELISQLNKGTYTEPSKMTLAEFLKDWMESVAKNSLKIATYEVYELILNTHILPALGHVKLPQLAPMVLQKFYNQKIDEGLSADYTRKIHYVLSSALNHAVKWRLLSTNPCSLTDPPKINVKEMKTWSIDELKRFLTHTSDTYLHIAYILALYTGMRMGEILGLRWKDIDFHQGRIHVLQSLARSKKGLIFQDTKSKGSKRSIDITEDVIAALKKHRSQQNQNKRLLGAAYKDHDLVVCSQLGTPMSRENLRRHYKRMIKECGVPKIRFHDLRHTHATIMLQLSEHPKIVSERLGHSRTSLTLDVYSHVTPGLQAQAAQKFSAALNQEN